MRKSLVPLAACAVLFLALVSCDSPGEPYRYRDLKIQPGLMALPALPGTTTPATVSFGIFNTDLLPMGPVEWQATMDGDPTPIASGTIPSLTRQQWASASFTTLPSPGVLHTYTVTLDPNNLISDDRDRNDNSAAIGLVFADANLSFATIPALTPAAPTIQDAPILTATVLNTDTSGALATLNGVQVLVREDATDLASTTIPSIAAGATGTAAIQLPAATAGSHTYTIIIDPANALILRNRVPTSTTVTVTVTVVAPG